MMMAAQGRPLGMRQRGFVQVLATWLLLMGCTLAGGAAAQDGAARDQEVITHRKLPPCAKPIEISSGDRALHDALRSMANCDGTIIFTEPGARFAAIDTLYRIYGNLTLDASSISPGVTLGSDNRPFVLHFQRGSSNTFFPGLTAKNVHFSENRRQLLGQTLGSHMMGNIITFENGGTAVFEGCRFADNVATFESTGWGAVGGGIMRLQNLTYARFTDCAFEGNEFSTVAQREALGFVWIQRPNGPTLFERCVFRDNRVSAAPGVGATAVYLDSDQARAQRVSFDSCVFEGNEGTGRAVLANQGAHVCGTVCSSTAVSRTALDVSFADCTFQANRVTGELGAPTVAANVNALGAAVGLFFGAAASFASCTFTDNAALNTASAPGNTANTFRAFGGAVHLNGVAATIDSGIFIGNTATGADDARGGALGLWTSNNAIPSITTIRNTFFLSNKALATGTGARMALGGGIATACAATATCRLSLISSGLESNQAMLVDSAVTTTTVLAQGGGLYATALRTAMTLDDTALSSNVVYARPASPATAAAVEGGGLFLLDSIASATSTAFSENSALVDNAEPSSSRVGGGGAAVVTASSANPSALTLMTSSFLLNTAGGVPRNQGGALYKDVPSQLSRSDDTKVTEMEKDANAKYKSFNDVHLAQAPAVIAPMAVSTTTSRPTPSPTQAAGTPAPTSRPTPGPTQSSGTPAPPTIAGECTRANGVASPVVLGAATQANTDLLHTALSGWRNCHGRVVFTEPGQVFTLPTGYIFSGNLTLDASGLSAPVTLRTGAPMEVSLLTFVSGGPNGILPSIVARNVVFADHKRVRTGATGGTWAMGGVISMQGGSSTVVFESCRFRNNELFFNTNGTGGCGVGGVRIARPALVRFDDCVFEDNSATCGSQNAAGGAVGIVDPVGPVSFTRCRWTNNKVTANIPFAAVARPYASGAAVFLANEQAAAQPVAFSQCTFEGNEAHVTPVNPEANFDATACGAVCGDPHVGKPALLDVAFSECGFSGNKATAHLSADTAYTAKAQLTAYGGAVGLFAGSTARFTDCMIKENVASTDDYVPGAGTSNRVYGGGVLLNGAAGSFEATRFAANSAIGPIDARGGGLYVMGATSPNLQQGPSSVSVARSTFFGNRALALGRASRGAFGGALGAACSSTSATCRIPLQLVDSVVEGNSATLQETVAAVTGTANAFARGGGLYIALPRDGVSLVGSNFSNNVAYGDAADASSALVVQGGGVYLQDATATSISSATFLQNTAWVAGAHEEASETAGGGVVLLTQTSSTPTVLTLAESSFLLNTAGGVPRNHGGALFKDALSTLNNEGGVRVVPMEVELAGTEAELDKSLNDVVLDEPKKEPAFATMAVSTSSPTSKSTAAPTAAPTMGTPTPQPTPQPSTAPTASPTLPVNCAVAWGGWSACSTECGPGVETQTGAVTQTPSTTGAQCPESLTRTRPCQLRNCLGTVFLQSGGAVGRADMVNPQEKVVLGVILPAIAGSAARRLPEGRELTFAWSGGDGGDLDLAATPAAALGQVLLTSVTDRYLAFKPGALQPGRAYVFACTVSDGVDKTTSKIAFTVNQPPSGGSFAITPAKGVALQTPFELSAKEWVDPEGHYPLRYRFALGADKTDTPIQSASFRASYTGMLGGWGAGMSVTCTVEDAQGATTTVTKAVDIDLPPMVRSDPNGFLADQMAGTQALLSQKDATVPGSATLVRVLLSLLACTETFNDPSAASLIDQRTLATRIKALLDSIEQVSLGLEQWSKGRSADDPNIDALEDALMMLTSLVGSLVRSSNEASMTATGSQYTALRVLGRTMDIAAATRLVPSSPEADAVLVDALAALADNGVFRPNAEGKFRTDAVDRLLGQLHARRAASMAPGEPTAMAAASNTRSQLAVFSSVVLAGSGDAPVEVQYRRSLTPAGRGGMRRFLSVARSAQAGADSSNSKASKPRPGVTLPTALINGKLPALGVGRECGGKASIQTTYWKALNPYFYQPGGQALGASFLTPVVSVRVGSCDEPAPRDLSGLAPEEEVIVAFPAARVPADLVMAAQQATVHNVTCVKGQALSRAIHCPYVAGTENEQATESIAAMTVRTEAAGSYSVSCSMNAAGEVSITCPKLELEPTCMYWDAAAQVWSTEGCRVVSTTLDAALAGAADGEDMYVETACSCQRTGAFAATVTPRLASAVPFHFAEADFPIVNHGGADGEGGAPIPQSAQAAALFVVFLAVFHIASFLIALILYSRWGQMQLLSKHAALLLQSKGAKRLLTSLVEAEAAKKRRWSVAAASPTGAAGGANPAAVQPHAFDNPIAEKVHAYNQGNAPQRHEEAAAADDGAKARRALYEAEQLYVAAQDRQRLFHGMEKSLGAKQLMAEVAYHEIGAFLTSKWLYQQQRLPEDEQAEHEHQASNVNATGQLPPATQQPHPAATLHLTIRPLAPGSAAANASAATGEEAAAAATAGAAAGGAATTAAKGRQPAAAAVRASVTATRLRQLDLQRTVLFVVKHLVLLLVCVGRFEAPTAQFGEWALRDCADVGAGALRPGSVCVQPQQFVFRNLIQFVLLLPLLLLLYVLLPVAIQRPRRQDQAWLRIWTDKAILGTPAPSTTASNAGDDDGPESILSKERLAEESMGRLVAMDAELGVLFEALSESVAVAAASPDAESLEAVDEARREVAVAAWRRRATDTSGLCWPRPRSAGARDRLRALGEIVESGDDPFKAFDRMVLTNLLTGSSRLRALQQWLKVLFYRLALADRDPMEGEVESEHGFAYTGLAVAVGGGALLVIFLICAIWYIVSAAIGWRMASAVLVLVYYIESVLFTVLVTTPLSLFLRNTGHQLLAAALESDLHALRAYLRDLRQARAAVIGDAAHMALLAQSPRDDDGGAGDHGAQSSLALTASVVSPLVAEPVELAPAAPPTAYIRRQRLQHDRGEAGVVESSEELSPRPDLGASSSSSSSSSSSAASAPPASPQSPSLQQQAQPSRWSVGRDRNGGGSNLQRGGGDRHII